MYIIEMTGQIKKSSRTSISTPLSLKRAITTATVSDSSTASSVDDADPDTSGKPLRRSRQEENKSRHYIDDSCKSDSPKRKATKRNRRRPISSCVSFGDVTVRIYSRSIGDWWDVQHGLSLGWEYKEMPAVPLPEDDDSIKSKSKLKKAVSKAKTTMKGWLLVKRKKRNSTGVIRADSVVDERKTDGVRIRTQMKERRREKAERAEAQRTKRVKPSRKSSYVECKPTSKGREELLKKFGFSSQELDDSETERKLLRFEYSHWTRSSQSRPSNLFLKRCLADFKECSSIDEGTATEITVA
mmetsp:Transcript_7184/g.17556  ORF Transcript_7184/g.17556 Transcript_7184/m.17556 type:complete len:299 (+) Transcript_7184:212-1108(+)